MKAIAPSYYNIKAEKTELGSSTNTGYSVWGEVGLIPSTAGDLARVFDQAFGTTITVARPYRLLIERSFSRFSFTNIQAYDCWVQLWRLIPRQHVVTTQSPNTLWTAGFGAMGAADLYGHMLTPYVNTDMQRYYYIRRWKRFKLPVGATRQFVLAIRKPMWVNFLDVGLLGTNTYLVKGSTCVFAQCYGQPIGSDATPNQSNTSTVRVKIMHFERYRFKFIEPFGSTLSQASDLDAITAANQIGVMRGQTQFNTASNTLPSNSGAAAPEGTVNL